MRPFNFFLLGTLYNITMLVDMDQECQNALNRLRDIITQPTIPSNPQDIQLMLYSGKQPFDLGSKSLCELNPEMKYMTINGNRGGLPFYIGVCMYQQCSDTYLNENKDQTIDAISTFTGTDISFGIEFQFRDENEPESLKKEQLVGFIFTFFILVVLSGLCILGTIVEHTTLFDDIQLPIEATSSAITKVSKKSKIGKFLEVFSLSKNSRVIFQVSETNSKQRDQSLQIFAGVRTLSMMYVIFGHIGLVNEIGVNYNDTARIQASTFGALLQGGFFAVDCFFLMSGFLAGYLLLQRMRNNQSCCAILELYFHRWCRLIPSLAMCTLIALYIIPFLLQGPLTSNYKSLVVANCNDYWWSNFLFINNFVPWSMFDQCIPWVWYLANDFQFFLLTPPLILLTLKYPRFVSFCMITLLTASIGLTIYIIYHNNIILPDRAKTYFDQYYSKPYSRLPAYLVGFLIGSIYRQTKDTDKPGVCRCGIRLMNSFGSSYVAWISAIFGVVITSVIIFSIKSAYNCGSDCWSLAHSAIYVAFSHPGFAFALMISLLPLLYDRLPWLKHFLAWSVFRVLARLTYCAYLIHLLVIIYYALSQHSSNYISKDNLVFHYFGLYCLSYIAALGLALIIEVPCTRLEKLLRQIYGSDEKKRKEGEIEFMELRQN